MSDFLIWMLGYPLMYSVSTYIDSLTDKNRGIDYIFDKEKESNVGIVNFVLWIGIGVGLFN